MWFLLTMFFCALFLLNSYFTIFSPTNVDCSTPFELHDDAYVLKSMRLCGRQNKEGTHDPIVERGESSSMLSVYQHHIPRASAIRGQPASPPIPGILKARIKHEQ